MVSNQHQGEPLDGKDDTERCVSEGGNHHHRETGPNKGTSRLDRADLVDEHDGSGGAHPDPDAVEESGQD